MCLSLLGLPGDLLDGGNLSPLGDRERLGEKGLLGGDFDLGLPLSGDTGGGGLKGGNLMGDF